MSQFIDVHSPVFPWHLHPAQLYALAQEYGLSGDTLLQAAGLSNEDISNSELLISWHQYRAMARLVEQHCPPHWGILMGQRLTLASHGLLSLAVMNCSGWDQVLDLMVKFKNLVTALFYVEKHDTDEHVILLLRPEFSRDPITQKFIECFFLAIYQAIISLAEFRDLIKSGTADFRIYLQHQKPDYNDISQAAFDQNIEYGYWCYALKVHQSYLQTPISNSNVSNPVITNNMVTLLKGQMQQMPILTGELHALHSLFGEQQFQLEKCASRLHTSATTLKRRLKQSDTSFNRELKLYRSEQAHLLLMYTQLSQDDIAQQLGFQDTGSFRRFFKAETGLTPIDFRHGPHSHS